MFDSGNSPFEESHCSFGFDCKTSGPIMSCSIFVDSSSDFGSSDFQSLLVQLWDARFIASWFDSEAVFLGSLVILGGFVAMGQRVKDICV